MKKIGIVSLVIAGLFFFFVGCNSSEPITDSGHVKVKMMAKSGMSSTNGLSSGRIAADSIIFSQALLGISKLEFETLEEDEDEHGECDSDSTDMDDDNSGHGDGDDDEDNSGHGSDGEENSGPGNHEDDGDDEDEIEFEGLFVFDLISGTSTPNFEVTPGLYEEIEVETAPILPNGKSAFITFEVTKGSQTFKVEFSTSAKIELEIERDEGFQIDGGSLTQILVLLKLDMLFANIDFSLATVGTDGVIRINETSNTALFNMIKGNLNESFETDEH